MKKISRKVNKNETVLFVFGLIVLICALCIAVGCGTVGKREKLPYGNENAATDNSYFRFVLVGNGSYTIAAKGADLPKTTILPATYEGKPVTTIAEEGFRERSSLEQIVIPESVQTIERKAFYKCIGLTSVVIPDGVQEIPHQCFYMSGLESVTIPKSVRSIGYSAFNGCSYLTVINFKGTMAEWNLIEKNEEGWSEHTGEYLVYCTDGTLPKVSVMD